MSQQTLSRFFPVKKETEGLNQGGDSRLVENGKLKPSTYEAKDTKVKITQSLKEETKIKSENPNKRKADNEDDQSIPSKITKTVKPKKSKTLTDFEQQILNFKLDHLDKLLLIQNGYRYKFFGEDAQIASKVLNIKLTDGKLSYDLQNPLPNDYLYSTFAQASIPIERLLVHVRRLIVKGYKVGVVNQIETAAIREQNKSKAKVFDRYLSNVYSAGTFINDEDLEKNVTGKSIIVICESIHDKTITIVSVNVYFSNIVYDEFTDNFTRFNLESRLHHLEPIEIITLGEISNETLTCLKNFKKYNESNTSNILLAKSDKSDKPYGQLLDDIKHDLSDDTFSFLMNVSESLLQCFYKLFHYLKEFNLTSIFQYLENFQNFSEINKNTILDSSVIKNLEIFHNITTKSTRGSLFELLDYTSTKFGSRTLKYWLQRPLVDKDAIIERHDAVNTLLNKLNGLQIERVRNGLKLCPDLELILSRIHYNRSNRKEVYQFLKKIHDFMKIFQNMHENLISMDTLSSTLLHTTFTSLKNLANTELSDISHLLSMINSPAAIDNKSPEHVTKYFNDTFFKYDEIEEHNEEIRKIHDLLDKELESIRKFTKNKDLQFTKVNNEPFLVQIRKSNVKHVPDDWIRISATVNCVRYRTPETVDLYKKLKYREDLLKLTCNKLFNEFIDKINSYSTYINKMISKLGEFDALLSLSIASINNKLTKPQIVDFPTIQIRNSRNPITETLLAEKNTSYIENTFNLQKSTTDKSRIALITGPNMGGKSSFIRQVGLIVILSQIGSFIPCDEGSILGIFSNICIRLGSNDDIFAGKSTFQVELTECRQILQTCIPTKLDAETNRVSDGDLPFNKIGRDGNSLILMDELGRGTSTVDGCSIAWSVLDYLVNDMGANTLCLFVTHFKELETFEDRSDGVVKNYHMGYRLLNGGDDLLFTYKLTSGYSEGSYGVYCAKIAGLPLSIVARADKISRDVETEAVQRNFAKMLSLINNKQVDDLYRII